MSFLTLVDRRLGNNNETHGYFTYCMPGTVPDALSRDSITEATL